MRQWATIAVLAVVAVQVHGVPLTQGIYEMQAGATFDALYNAHERLIPVHVGIGYYVTDQWQIGAAMSFSKKNSDSFWNVDDVWGIGAFAEYTFLNDRSLLPFAGFSATVLDGNDASGDTAVVLTGSGGAKYFFTPSVAAAAQINVNWASEEIYDFDRDYGKETGPKGGDGTPFDVSATVSVRLVLW